MMFIEWLLCALGFVYIPHWTLLQNPNWGIIISIVPLWKPRVQEITQLLINANQSVSSKARAFCTKPRYPPLHP